MAGMLSGNNFSAKVNDAFTFVPSLVIICKKNQLDLYEFTPQEKKKNKDNVFCQVHCVNCV